MSSFHNIDELLKGSFKDYAPQAPDVWNQVSQQISTSPSAPQAPNAPAAGSKIVTAIKSASITTKIVAALAVPATFVGAYAGYKYLNKDKDVVVETKPQTEITIPSKPQVIVPEEYTTIEQDKPVIEPITEHKSARDHTRVRRGDDTNANKMKNVISDLPPSGPVILTSPALNQEKGNPEINRNTTPDVTTDKSQVTNQAKPDEGKKQADKEPAETVSRAKTGTNSNTDDDPEPFIPNTFSPDGDGINDLFVIPIENETQYAIKILNRSNEVVFESNNKNVLWDGVNVRNGQPCETGLYTYTFRYQYKNGKDHVKIGKIQLIR